MRNNRNKSPDFGDINTILDKMIQLEKSKNKVSIYKLILLIAGCVAMLILLVALCVIFYKNHFSFESLLSLLLAFFSIFISIFFYFKADETSNKFYDSSYDFMKDVSVTLGKIEERFGEKLNNLNDKVSHLSAVKDEKTEELQNVEDEKQKMIEELLDKAKMNEKQKEEYVKRLREKEDEADYLRSQLQMIDLKYKTMIQKRDHFFLTPKERHLIMHRHSSDWPIFLKKKMIEMDFMYPDGELTAKGEILFEGLRENSSTGTDE